MPKGNPKGYLNAPIYAPQPDDKEKNAVMIQCVMDLFNAPTPDLHKPEEVEAAITGYFNNCISKGLRPGNLGLYAALGMTKREVQMLLSVQTTKKASPETIVLLKKAIKTLSTFRELLGAEGKLNPATLIFWQKNFDGLEDQQTITVEASATETALTPEEIAKRIEDDIPVDVDDCTVTDA